jgi:hypothetical protein
LQGQDVRANVPDNLLGHGVVFSRQDATVERLANFAHPEGVEVVEHPIIHSGPVVNRHEDTSRGHALILRNRPLALAQHEVEGVTAAVVLPRFAEVAQQTLVTACSTKHPCA